MPFFKLSAAIDECLDYTQVYDTSVSIFMMQEAVEFFIKYQVKKKKISI